MKKSKILWAISVLIIFFNVLFYAFRFGGDSVLLYVSDLLPVACSFISAVCLLIAFRAFASMDYIKFSWLLLFFGLLLFFLAESVYAVLEIVFEQNLDENWPSVADYLWCAGYVPQFACLVMLLRGYLKTGLPLGNIKTYMALSAVFIVLCGSIIYYLLIPIVVDPESDLLTKIFSLFYPIADLFVVAPALLLMYITNIIGRGRLARPWMFIAIGFIFFTASDLLYSYLSWQGLYGSGNFIDIGWNAGYLLIALSAIYQKELLESVSEGWKDEIQ